jgi:HTH-type transcriptional repressor of NAD biosynthesis genes
MYFKGQKSGLINDIIKMQDYDLVIYLEPDVRWIDDGIRFAGEKKLRQKNNKKLKQMYKYYGIEFETISGNYKQRFEKATGLINKLFEK